MGKRYYLFEMTDLLDDGLRVTAAPAPPEAHHQLYNDRPGMEWHSPAGD